eukprot:TRINITY_DN1176_c0_g1_i1.p1 TRINITY_DN1176_c0_g1~~TRINITY_DN1176_c0_g1_i1.p1  ORF type:complete len:128 (+),score=28.64 TRINITY_DN1176_c0_g1_i1:130-513(+)
MNHLTSIGRTLPFKSFAPLHISKINSLSRSLVKNESILAQSNKIQITKWTNKQSKFETLEWKKDLLSSFESFSISCPPSFTFTENDNETEQNEMELDSVVRKRAKRMKKHKHKKLRKRDRHERNKLK